MPRIDEPRALNIRPVGRDYEETRDVRASFDRGEEFEVLPGEGEWSERIVTREVLAKAGFVAAHVHIRAGRSTRRLKTQPSN